KAVAAQQAIDEFNASHSGDLNSTDQEEWARLRLTLDLANVRVMDLRNRIDQAALAPAILDMSGLEFQVVDEPREAGAPHGGPRPGRPRAARAGAPVRDRAASRTCGRNVARPPGHAGRRRLRGWATRCRGDQDMTLDDPLPRSFDGLASRVDATGFRSVAFTSALAGEGVSTIALGTAL